MVICHCSQTLCHCNVHSHRSDVLQQNRHTAVWFIATALLVCAAVICSDKTGTLTTNQMCVAKVAVLQSSTAQLAEYGITG